MPVNGSDIVVISLGRGQVRGGDEGDNIAVSRERWILLEPGKGFWSNDIVYGLCSLSESIGTGTKPDFHRKIRAGSTKEELRVRVCIADRRNQIARGNKRESFSIVANGRFAIVVNHVWRIFPGDQGTTGSGACYLSERAITQVSQWYLVAAR